VLAFLKENPPSAAGVSPPADNGHSMPDTEENQAVDTEQVVETFRELRIAAQAHLQNEKAFYRTLVKHLDELERAVQFEQKRNREIQDGLRGILAQLNLPSGEVAKIEVDVRPKQNVGGRVWAWMGTKKRRAVAVLYRRTVRSSTRNIWLVSAAEMVAVVVFSSIRGLQCVCSGQFCGHMLIRPLSGADLCHCQVLTNSLENLVPTLAQTGNYGCFGHLFFIFACPQNVGTIRKESLPEKCNGFSCSVFSFSLSASEDTFFRCAFMSA